MQIISDGSVLYLTNYLFRKVIKVKVMDSLYETKVSINMVPGFAKS